MKQNSPQFGRMPDPAIIAGILCVGREDMVDSFPVQEVSTGLPSIIVPLNSLDAVKRCRINHLEFMKFADDSFSANILVFCNETYNKENDLNVRVFADDCGYPEDAATGSANGSLAGYLLEYGYFGVNEIQCRVEQGFEMRRPSLLKISAGKTDNRFDINVGGKVFAVARGEWY